MTSLLLELRSATRSLAASRGFAATAIVTLGLGMALCAATLAVVDAYLLRELPYPGADRLYWVRFAPPGQPSPRDLESHDWASLDDIVEHAIAWDLDMFYMVGREHTEPARGAWVTPGFMAGFGIQPILGMGFDAQAWTPGGPNVALISHALWTARFGGDPGIVGKAFSAYVSDRPDEAESFTIVGVLPPQFWHFNPYTDVLVPLRAPTYPYMVRLRDGVTAERAIARFSSLVSAHGRQSAADVQFESAHGRYTLTLRPVLRAAMAAATLVLLVACANVAALLLVRATAREKELSVRVALGASRAVLARTLALEAVLITLGATLVAGIATAAALTWFGPAIQEQMGRPAPGGATLVSLRTMAAIVGVALVTALACGLAPLVTMRALRTTHGLQGTERTSTGGAASQRLRTTLIVGEIAISFALVTGAAMMLQTIATLSTVDWGLSPRRVSTTGLALRQARYPDAASRANVLARLIATLRATPTASSIALSASSLIQQPGLIDAGRTAADAGATKTALHRVSDAYFETLGIPVVAGRVVNAADRLGTEPVAVVSATLARRLWSAQSAIGQQLVTTENRGEDDERSITRTVIGIAGDVRQTATDEEQADVYVPLMQEASRFVQIIRRATPEAATVNSASEMARRAVRAVDPEIALNDTRLLEDALAAELQRPRFMTRLLTTLALISVLLALVGMYGLVSYAVRQREREIAIRVAVGAAPSRITRLLLGHGVGALMVGLALGLAGALAVGRLLETQLVGVGRHDIVTLAGSGLAFAAVAIAALWWPARRAAAMDPAPSLRSA